MCFLIGKKKKTIDVDVYGMLKYILIRFRSNFALRSSKNKDYLSILLKFKRIIWNMFKIYSILEFRVLFVFLSYIFMLIKVYTYFMGKISILKV